MYIIIGILALVILIQTWVLWTYQRQIKDICRQLSFLQKHDSNMIITHEISWGRIRELVELLNGWNTKHKKERNEYLEKEKKIAEIYTSLSHDIRTPLTSLDGYVQLLGASESQEEQKRYLYIVQERITSLKDMLEELFTYTKLKNESYQLEITECCVNKILKNTIFSYFEDWQRRGIEPEIEITDKLLYIQGNSQGLRRVIQNIVKNALDHGEKKIGISLQEAENRAVLKVSNYVENAEEIDVSQVFERFYKQDKARSHTSTGLGLSIAREFVCRMNGEIAADVAEKEFCITIRFPLAM